MKRLTIIIILAISSQVYANMANPVIEGTFTGRPFISEFVDVIHEDLLIKIDKHFHHASFYVQYHINSTKDGYQIPFLFYASEYLDSFSVKIDGKKISLTNIPYDFKVPEDTKFKDFSYFFEKSSANDFSSILIEDSAYSEFHVSLADMIYFETDVPHGEHVIEVSYIARNWTNRLDWVNEYSFRYALSPAKYWKSFGTLNVNIDASDFDQELNVNLGHPKNGNLQSIAQWEFNNMPIEIVKISFNPKVSPIAQTLIEITPIKIAYITGAIFTIIHFFTLMWYRKKHPIKRLSIAVVIGSFLIPLVFLMSWINSYFLIDFFIGEYASGMHGYTFFVILLYPIIMPVYGLISWFIDKWIKTKYALKKQV